MTKHTDSASDNAKHTLGFETRDLTIVIPTYRDGIKRLLALLPHWTTTQTKLLVVDGSLKSNLESFKKFDQKASLVNYVHLPVGASGTRANYYYRRRWASSLVDTPYVGLCGDDDFYTNAGITEVLKELQRNSHIDVVVGRTAMLTWDDKNRRSSLCLHHTEPVWMDHEFRRSSRLRDRIHAEDGIGYYSIGRSDFLTRLWSFVFSQQDLDPYWSEYQIKWLTELGANMRVLPHLLWIRSPERSNSKSCGHRELMKRCSDEPSLKNMLIEQVAEGLATLRRDIPIRECERISSELIEFHIERASLQCARSVTLEQRVSDYVYIRIVRCLNHPLLIELGIWRFADWMLKRCGFGGLGLPRICSSNVKSFVKRIGKLGVPARVSELELTAQALLESPLQMSDARG